MDIRTFRSAFEKLTPPAPNMPPKPAPNAADDRFITIGELKTLTGDDHSLSQQEAEQLGIDTQSADFINRALGSVKDLSKESEVLFRFDSDDQAIQVQRIGGAIFNKLVTPAAADTKGITSSIKLPAVALDPDRYYMAKDDKGVAQPDAHSTGPLDRPSVYMGGNISEHLAGGALHEEMDVGLSWSRVYAPGSGQRPTYTNQAQGSDGGNPKQLFLKAEAKAVLLGKASYLSYQDAQGKPAFYDPSKNKVVTDSALIAKLRVIKPEPGKGSVLALDGESKVRAAGDKVEGFFKNLKPNFAFRPYWRTTNNEVYHPPGNSKERYVKVKNSSGEPVLMGPKSQVLATGKDKIAEYLRQHGLERMMNDDDKSKTSGNQWANPPVGSASNLYFYPNEDIRMTVQVTGENTVEMAISSKGKSFRQSFVQENFGLGMPQQFKHVHSLDQFRTVQEQGKVVRKGNENREFLPTAASLDNIRWKPEILKADGSAVPMNRDNSLRITAKDMLDYHTKVFTTDANGQDIEASKGFKPDPSKPATKPPTKPVTKAEARPSANIAVNQVQPAKAATPAVRQGDIPALVLKPLSQLGLPPDPGPTPKPGIPPKP